MPKISLTASMRSNLLSLQNISGQVSLTQNRLATGKKVNSAIDNPSSFYTASSLNNRAKDLDNLLDTMSQATSTIKAATTALETATTFLEQASAVATQALETAIPAKEYFEELVGENGAVVSTAQELKDAVAAGKETICVYGKIDYFENETLTLKDGQNLVGTEYFTGYTGKEKFSQINFRGNMTDAISCNNGDFLISDLKLDQQNFQNSTYSRLLYIETSMVSLNNIDVSKHDEYYIYENATMTAKSSNIKIYGNNNFSFSGAGAKLGIYLRDTTLDIDFNSALNIEVDTPVSGTTALCLDKNSLVDVRGKLCINTPYRAIMGTEENNCINVYNKAELCIQTGPTMLALGPLSSVNFYDGALINAKSQFSQGEFISKGYSYTTASDENISQHPNTYKYSRCFIEKEPSIDWDTWQAVEDKEKDTATEDASKQYSEILTQYDTLVNDGSYKGVNLLKDDELKVNFNEKSTASLEVKGKDMSSASLGFVTKDWTNQGDIAQTLKEISSALNSIRNYNAELGNNYSIITSRQNFTESLINILTEGADKLTLADMNEESANMLALQTRQQLAINSLSLASQASQSVLKLF